MNLYELIGEWFWLLALIFSLVYLRTPRAVKHRMEGDQGFADTQMRLRKRMWVLMSFPWILMGAGQILGGVPNVWHYFRPQDLNPWVLGFYAAAVVAWCLSIYWVFFLGGARLAAEHQLFRVYWLGRPVELTENLVKIVVLIMIGGGCMGLIMMFFFDFKVPA